MGFVKTTILLTSGLVSFFRGWLPTYLCDLLVELKQSVVLATVGANLDQLGAILHVGEAVWCWKENIRGY